jgi:acylphosphatase
VVVVRRFLILCRVQGVGFRFFSLEAGVRAGLGGFVRNLEDGRFEAQGEQAG